MQGKSIYILFFNLNFFFFYNKGSEAMKNIAQQRGSFTVPGDIQGQA